MQEDKRKESLYSWFDKKLSRPIFFSFFVLFVFQLAVTYYQMNENKVALHRSISSLANIVNLALHQKNRALLEIGSGFAINTSGVKALCVLEHENIVFKFPFENSQDCKFTSTFFESSESFPVSGFSGYYVAVLSPRFPELHKDLIFFVASLLLVVPIYYVLLRARKNIEEDIIRPLKVGISNLDMGVIHPENLSVPAVRIEEIDAMFEDYTKKLVEIKNLTENKIKLEKEASIGRITSHLTHDLRAPLGVFERLLLTPADQFVAMKSSIRDSLNRLYSMIESLRHSEVENLIQRSKSTVNFIYGEETLQAKAEEYSVKLSIPLSDLEEIWIDPMKVERAWINLASNAIEAAKSFVRVETERQGTTLFIRVIDDGPGVPNEALSKLFQRGMTFGKAGGTGLGLAYVKQIMQGHGGDVAYRRDDGLTIFECRLAQAYAKNEGEKVSNLAFSKDTIGKTDEKKVCVKLIPESLALGVCKALSSYPSKTFSFSCDWGDDTHIIVLNDDELVFQVMDEGKEPLQLSKNLDQKQIVDRLARKFNLV